jgi:hypothetical protein
MATYVNLSVNQGLINKAKQVQSQNRKRLGERQPLQAKKKPATVQDPGKKFGTQYQRRRVGASSDSAIGTGFVRATLTHLLQPQFDITGFRQSVSGLFTQNGRISVNLPVTNLITSRTYYCQDGREGINFDMSPLASMPPYFYEDPLEANSNKGQLREVIMPVGGSTCIIFVALITTEVIQRGPLSAAVQNRSVYVKSYLSTESSIREIATPQLLVDLIGPTGTFNQVNGQERYFSQFLFLASAHGRYGWNNDYLGSWRYALIDPYIGHNYSPDVFDGLKWHINSLANDPSGLSWDNTDRFILIDESNVAVIAPGRSVADENNAFLAWATDDGSFPTASSPYQLVKIESPIPTNVFVPTSDPVPFNQTLGIPASGALMATDKSALGMIHPASRWWGSFVAMQKAPVNSFGTPFLLDDGSGSTYQFGVPYPFWGDWSFYNTISGERPLDVPPLEDQSLYIGFTDWGAPDYCIEQLIALGYRPEDLS